VAHGPFTAGQPLGYATIGSTQYAAAAAYQLTLTNTGSTTAAVDGFVVAFYNSSGQELGSDQENLSGPTYITAGQSLAWTQVAQDDMLGNALADDLNVAGNSDASIPAGGFATCELAAWLYPEQTRLSTARRSSPPAALARAGTAT
jgi:hypothetical protein